MYKSNKQSNITFSQEEWKHEVLVLTAGAVLWVEALPLYITRCMSHVYFFTSTDVPGSFKPHTPSHDTLGVLGERLKPTFRWNVLGNVFNKSVTLIGREESTWREGSSHGSLARDRMSYLALKAEGYCCPRRMYCPSGCFTLDVLVSVLAYIAAFIRLPIKYTIGVRACSCSSLSPSRLSRTTGCVRLQRNNSFFDYMTGP